MNQKIIRAILGLTTLFLVSCTKDKEEEWQSLFNGNNLDNWTVKIHHHEVGENFGNTFRAEENMIKNTL